MKAHNPRLCRTPRASIEGTTTTSCDKVRVEVDGRRSSVSDGSSAHRKRDVTSAHGEWRGAELEEERGAELEEDLVMEEELQDVLLQLQDEFGHMSL